MELGKSTKALSTSKVITKQRKNFSLSLSPPPPFILYLFVGGVQVSQGTYVKLLRVDSLLPPCELEYQTQVNCLVASAFSSTLTGIFHQFYCTPFQFLVTQQ